MQQSIKVRMEWVEHYEADNYFTGATESGYTGDKSPWSHAAISFAKCLLACPNPERLISEIAHEIETMSDRTVFSTAFLLALDELVDHHFNADRQADSGENHE